MFNKYDKSKQIELYQSGLSTAEIAAQLDISTSTVVRTIRAAGIKRKLELDSDKIAELYTSGKSLAAVGQEVGASIESIRLVLLAAGIERRPRGVNSPNIGAAVKSVINGKKIETAVRRFGVDRRTVRKHVNNLTHKNICR